jgi:lysophospholipase L1-like esterase
MRSRIYSRKRLFRTCILIVLLGIAAWLARRPLHRQYQRDKSRYLSAMADALRSPRYLEAPWAHCLLSDFAQLQRYHAQNQSLPANVPGRVIFYGDSITDVWPTAYAAQFFPGKPYIGRGITGQSTNAMLWRFQQDVLDLHPSIVVILGGSNDVVLTERHIPFKQTTANIQSMVELAQRHHIRVILCSLPPVSHYPPRKQALFSEEIRTLNHWLSTYAANQNLTYVDYYSAMVDNTGAMRNSLSVDGLHPNAAGYSVMEPLVQQAIYSR